MQAERSGYRRRACDARSYPPCIEHTAEVQCGDGGWIPEGEIGDSNTPPNAWCKERIYKQALLVQRLLCEHGGIGRAEGARLRPESGRPGSARIVGFRRVTAPFRGFPQATRYAGGM